METQKNHKSVLIMVANLMMGVSDLTPVSAGANPSISNPLEIIPDISFGTHITQISNENGVLAVTGPAYVDQHGVDQHGHVLAAETNLYTTGVNQNNIITVDAGANHNSAGAFFAFNGFWLSTQNAVVFTCSSCAAQAGNVFVKDDGFASNLSTPPSLLGLSDSSLKTNANASLIDGSLEFGAGISSNAGLWFINPNGVVVGNQGSVDVPAAFYVANASDIQFNYKTAGNPYEFGVSTTSRDITQYDFDAKSVAFILPPPDPNLLPGGASGGVILGGNVIETLSPNGSAAQVRVYGTDIVVESGAEVNVNTLAATNSILINDGATVNNVTDDNLGYASSANNPLLQYNQELGVQVAGQNGSYVNYPILAQWDININGGTLNAYNLTPGSASNILAGNNINLTTADPANNAEIHGAADGVYGNLALFTERGQLLTQNNSLIDAGYVNLTGAVINPASVNSKMISENTTGLVTAHDYNALSGNNKPKNLWEQLSYQGTYLHGGMLFVNFDQAVTNNTQQMVNAVVGVIAKPADIILEVINPCDSGASGVSGSFRIDNANNLLPGISEILPYPVLQSLPKADSPGLSLQGESPWLNLASYSVKSSCQKPS